MNLAKRLKEARQSRQLTQKAMAKAAGVALQMWQAYESGKSTPGGQVLAALARLGVNTNWLLTGEGEKEEVAATQALAVSPTILQSGDDAPCAALLKGLYAPSIIPFRVVGASMGRTIQDGACVWVDTEDRTILSGEIYAVRLPAEGTVIKRLYVNGNGVDCCCDNPEFPNFCIPFSEIQEPFVLGRVKWTLQPV